MTNIMVWQHCQYETLDVDMADLTCECKKISGMVWQHCQYETLDVDMIRECTLADLTIVAPTGTLSSLSNTI